MSTNDDPAPDWASFLGTAERWDAFDSAVRSVLRSMGHKAMISDGVLRIVGHDASSASNQPEFGLTNIAQACAQSPESHWPSLIERHFQLALKMLNAPPERTVKNFAAIRDALCVRLWADTDDDTTRDISVWRSDLPGLRTTLMVDRPDFTQTLRPDDVHSLGVPPGELFAIALSNLDRLAPVRLESNDLGQGQSIHELFGESFFAASWALRIEERPQFFGPHGVFFAVPTRHRLLAMPFVDLQSLQAVAMLMHAATGMHRDGPGSITPAVLWKNPRATLEIPYSFGDNRLEITPPDQLVELMEKLGG